MTADRATARGALVGIATVVAERGVAFMVILALAHLMTPAEFGQYGYLLAGISLVQVIADQGLEVAAVARMAASPAESGSVVGAVLRWRLLLWAVVVLPVGGLVLTQVGAEHGGMPIATGVAASLVAILGASITARGVRRARGAMLAMARVALADALVGGAAVIGAVAAGGGVPSIFVARALASGAVTVVALARDPGRRRAASTSPAMAALGMAALPLGLNAVLIATQTRAGHLVGMALGGAELVAMLSAAARVSEVLGVLPEGVLLAVFPRMASEPAAAVALAGAAARRLAVVVLAGVCGIAVAAPEVGARLFGAPYAAAGPAIAVLAWGALFSATGGVILYAVTALGRQGALVVANLIAATAGVGLQLVLVPAMGLRGAALATIATAACGQAVLAFHPATRAVVRAVWGRVVVPAAIAALVVATVGRLRSDVTGGALAFVAYAAAVHVTRVVGRDDWGELARAVVGRRG